MKTSQTAAMALIVLVAETSTWATGADRTRPTDVPLSSARHGEVVIPVFVGGEGPYRFILDTGSSHTAISQTLATALGAVPVAKAPVATSVGTVLSLVIRLADVTVGSAHVESLLATALPPGARGLARRWNQRRSRAGLSLAVRLHPRLSDFPAVVERRGPDPRGHSPGARVFARAFARTPATERALPLPGAIGSRFRRERCGALRGHRGGSTAD